MRQQQLWSSMDSGKSYLLTTIARKEQFNEDSVAEAQVNKQVASSGFDVNNPTGYVYIDKPEKKLRRPLTAKFNGYA